MKTVELFCKSYTYAGRHIVGYTDGTSSFQMTVQSKREVSLVLNAFRRAFEFVDVVVIATENAEKIEKEGA